MEFPEARVAHQKIHWKSLGLILWGFGGFCNPIALNYILIPPAFRNYMDLFGYF